MDWQGSNSSVDIHQNYSKVDTNCNHTSHSAASSRQPKHYRQLQGEEWTEGLGQQEQFPSQEWIEGQQKADDWIEVVVPPKNPERKVSGQQTSYSSHLQTIYKPYNSISKPFEEPSVSTKRTYPLYNNPDQNNIDSNDFSEATHPRVYYECKEVKSNGVFAYALSCHQFLNCWKGRGYLQNCPAGTLFNPKTSECDFPSKVECMSGPWMIKRSERLINDPRQAEESQGLQPSKQDNDRKGAMKSFKQAETRRVSCPDSATGLFPHPSDCSKFLNCANGQTFVQDCGPGTVFNPAISTCDWPYNVNCKDRYLRYLDSFFKLIEIICLFLLLFISARGL